MAELIQGERPLLGYVRCTKDVRMKNCGTLAFSAGEFYPITGSDGEAITVPSLYAPNHQIKYFTDDHAWFDEHFRDNNLIRGLRDAKRGIIHGDRLLREPSRPPMRGYSF